MAHSSVAFRFAKRVCVLLVCVSQGYTEAQYVDEAIAFITNYLKVNGPYDGFIGFS